MYKFQTHFHSGMLQSSQSFLTILVKYFKTVLVQFGPILGERQMKNVSHQEPFKGGGTEVMQHKLLIKISMENESYELPTPVLNNCGKEEISVTASAPTLA